MIVTSKVKISADQLTLTEFEKAQEKHSKAGLSLIKLNQVGEIWEKLDQVEKILIKLENLA